MKVVALNVAPRMESGNTQSILNPFIIGLKQAGAAVDLIMAEKKDVRQCIGCFSCYATTPGICVHDDEMPGIINRISDADIFVLASPIYLDGITSLGKKLIDRMVVFLDPHFSTDEEGVLHPLRKKFPSKMVLVSVCGYPGVQNFDPLVNHFKRLSRNFHSEFSGAVLRPAAFSMLLTRKYPEKIKAVMDAIRTAGSEVITQGKIAESTSEAIAAEICSPDELVAMANAYWDRELDKLNTQKT
jgi:hypothetical protein